MDPDDRQYGTGIVLRIPKSDFAMYYCSSSFRLATAFTPIYECSFSRGADFPLRAAAAHQLEGVRTAPSREGCVTWQGEDETAEILAGAAVADRSSIGAMALAAEPNQPPRPTR